MYPPVDARGLMDADGNRRPNRGWVGSVIITSVSIGCFGFLKGVLRLLIVRHLDHSSNTYRQFKLTAEQFIACLIQHIPDTGFRMIRYYGFLANRLRGKILPKIHKLLGQMPETDTRQPPSYAELIQKNFGFGPLTYILCGHKLILSRVQFGIYKTAQLLTFHQELANCTCVGLLRLKFEITQFLFCFSLKTVLFDRADRFLLFFLPSKTVFGGWIPIKNCFEIPKYQVLGQSLSHSHNNSCNKKARFNSFNPQRSLK